MRRLAARVLAVEHRILPPAVEALALGGVPGEAHDGPLCFDLIASPAPPEASVRATLAFIQS